MEFLFQNNLDEFLLSVLFELLAGILVLIFGSKRIYKKNKVKLGLSPLKYTCTVIITYAILAVPTYYIIGMLEF